MYEGRPVLSGYKYLQPTKVFKVISENIATGEEYYINMTLFKFLLNLVLMLRNEFIDFPGNAK